MKNIFFGSLIAPLQNRYQIPEGLKDSELGALISFIRSHEIHQAVIFAASEMRLVVEELWMKWKQRDPECVVVVEYIAAADLDHKGLKSAMQRYLFKEERCRVWCFLDNYQSSHEAFQRAWDMLSESMNGQFLLVDPTTNTTKDDDYLSPSVEEENPHHWSIFEKIKMFET
ncbi:MAG: hypothetical protein LBG98_00655 [Puniceicoccales bacterium]|jgi:hypothetical protein|nr:hypothetical protein [Puniceicoccales bacterium]